MTNQEKAIMYETIVREGDALNREKSKIKSESAGRDMSPVQQKRVTDIDKRLNMLENMLNELIR